MSRAVLTVLAAVVATTAACGLVSSRTDLSEEARNEIIGSARLAHEVDGATNGKDSLQVLTVVLDLGVTEAGDAVREEEKRLESAGWQFSESDGRIRGHSEKVNATATIYTLDQYLAASHQLKKPVDDIRKKFEGARGLIVVTATPRTHDG